MKCSFALLITLPSVFVAAALSQTPVKPSDTTFGSCTRPYEWGHVTLTWSEWIGSPHQPTNKQQKEFGKQHDRVQTECNSFVRENFNRPVAKDFLLTVKGFTHYTLHCESFCGSREDLYRLIEQEAKDAMKK